MDNSMIAIAALICVALLPIAITRLFRNRISIGWAIVIAINVALIVGITCYLKFASWKTDQSMHIRWNVQWFSDQYNRIDKLGNEDLRRDYVTNFCHNACTLLNLDCKTAPTPDRMRTTSISVKSTVPISQYSTMIQMNLQDGFHLPDRLSTQQGETCSTRRTQIRLRVRIGSNG